MGKTILRFVEDNGLECDGKKTSSGVWEIRLAKR
jgi:hypothetical protein